MHVARYLVRSGAQQRSVIALLDAETAHSQGELLTELLEASGAAQPQVLPVSAEAALPLADVLLFGQTGISAAETAANLRKTRITAPPFLPAAAGATQVWAIDVDALLAPPGPGIVDHVESLIRIVMPEALGANGTPPSEAVAIRIA